MRTPLVAGNWKMHLTAGEAVDLVSAIRKELDSFTGAEVVVCPPFTALAKVAGELKGSRVKLGAQNMHWEENGAFTGEIAPSMLVDAGCGYVILGHSERRQYFGENNEDVNKKIKAALRHGLLPVVCVGETLAQREAGETKTVVGTQVREALRGLTPSEVDTLVLAYEPIWAIGTGKTASSGDAQEVCRFIRMQIEEEFALGSSRLRVLYGGSVKPENAASLMKESDIDGALVGGASLSAQDFARIVLAAAS